MILKENKSITGVVTATQLITTSDGHKLSLTEAIKSSSKRLQYMRDHGISMPKQKIVKSNLVTNVGGSFTAHSIGGDSSAYIDRVIIGDTMVGGVATKSTNPPDLGDTTLVHQLRNVLGQLGGVFALDSHSYPSSFTKYNPISQGVLVAGINTFTDSSASFINSGLVTKRDVVKAKINNIWFTLGIVSVDSEFQLTVENPYDLSGSSLEYTVNTSGTQILFRKLLDGNAFPESEYGPVTVIHEAGLLTTEGELFNRVVFIENDDTIGMILSPSDLIGTTISLQLDFLITF